MSWKRVDLPLDPNPMRAALSMRRGHRTPSGQIRPETDPIATHRHPIATGFVDPGQNPHLSRTCSRGAYMDQSAGRLNGEHLA